MPYPAHRPQQKVLTVANWKEAYVFERAIDSSGVFQTISVEWIAMSVIARRDLAGGRQQHIKPTTIVIQNFQNSSR